MKRRMSSVLARLGDFEFGDGDFGSPSLDFGGGGETNWFSDFGQGNEPTLISTEIPPTLTSGAGLDLNKIVQTSTGLYYQYKAQTGPNGQTTYVPKQVPNPKGGTMPTAIAGIPIIAILGIGALLLLRKKR